MNKHLYFPGWNVVIGSGVGIGFGSVPFFASGFALLAAAMAKDFGWGQPDVAQAASIYLLLQTVAYPLCGWPLDRWGSRKFATLSIVLFAGSLLVLSQIGGSLWQLDAAFALMGIVAAGNQCRFLCPCDCTLVQPKPAAWRWGSRQADRRSARS